MSQNMNQFNQSAEVGELDLQTNPNPATFTCKFKDASETADTTLSPVRVRNLSTWEPLI